jgi:XTP/dITP diphosphohydrolase
LGYHDGKDVHVFIGEVYGSIAVEERGTDGFGFDPIIIPNGQKLTYAEMGLEGKNTMSHRKRALELFREFLDSQKNKKDI